MHGLRQALLLILLTVAACTAPQPAGDPLLLSFLTPGETTRNEVERRLGAPSGRFEDGQVLTYRLGRDPRGGFRVRSGQTTWAGTDDSLVLRFDLAGRLLSHTRVPVR